MRTPTAVLWLAVDEKDTHYIYDELWLKDMDIKQVSQAILSQEASLTPMIRLIDPHADKEDTLAGGFNVRKELMRHGVFTQRGNSDPILGKDRIRQMLKPRWSVMSRKEVPQLFVSSYCKQTIFEFQHYIWDEYARNREEFNAKETAKKKNDHFMDCLRYIYNFGPRYIEKERDEGDLEYTGKYTKYPTEKSSSGYHDLVERTISKGGNF
jgi:hypothetical protein